MSVLLHTEVPNRVWSHALKMLDFGSRSAVDDALLGLKCMGVGRDSCEDGSPLVELGRVFP